MNTSVNGSQRPLWLVAIAATLAMAVSHLDRQTLAAVATSVKAALSLDHQQYGWLQSAFSIAYLVAAPLAGLLVDRVGAKKGLVLALIVWSLVAGAHAFAVSFGTLFFLRILLGVAEAPSFPACARAINAALPVERRSLGFGLLFTGSSIGVMVAIPLANALTATFGWRFAFLGAAAVGLLWVPLWLVATRQLRETVGPTSTVTAAPVSYAAILSDPAVLRAVAVIFGSAPSIAFVISWLPLYLQRTYGLPETGVGKYVWLPALLYDLGAVLFGAWASRRDKRRAQGGLPSRAHGDMMVIGALLTAALALIPWASSVWATVILAGLSMAGGGVLYARLTADMFARIPASRAATAGGITTAAQSIAYIITNPLVGSYVDAKQSYEAPIVAVALIGIPAVAIWLALPVRETDPTA